MRTVKTPHQLKPLCTSIVGVWHLHDAFEPPIRIQISAHQLHLHNGPRYLTKCESWTLIAGRKGGPDTDSVQVRPFDRPQQSADKSGSCLDLCNCTFYKWRFEQSLCKTLELCTQPRFIHGLRTDSACLTHVGETDSICARHWFSCAHIRDSCMGCGLNQHNVSKQASRWQQCLHHCTKISQEDCGAVTSSAASAEDSCIITGTLPSLESLCCARC